MKKIDLTLAHFQHLLKKDLTMAYITDPALLIEDLRSQEFDDAADMIERLMAENAKLREALKPFADDAEEWGTQHVDSKYPTYDFLDTVSAKFTVGDLRRAAALLKETK